MTTLEEEIVELDHEISRFIDGRKKAKIEAAEEDFRKGKLDAEALEQRRARLEEEYAPRAWIESAAKRASRIRIATHITKAIHPDSKASPVCADGLSSDEWTGTPPSVRHRDVSGNAGDMDVNGFLSIAVAGRTVGARIMEADPAMRSVLERHGMDFSVMRDAFSATFGTATVSADTWTKQVYFPVGEDRYHLLAPLYPSALVHEVHTRIRETRFGEAATQARRAKREGQFYEDGLVEYPGLVLTMFGSGKPQNISVLTNARRGEAYLMPSLPPIWQRDAARPIWHARTVFDRAFPRRVRRQVEELASYLVREERNNIHIRRHRAEMVREVVDELVELESVMASVDPGWSADERCELDLVERLWLDPGRAALDTEFEQARSRGSWRAEIADRFARWLNASLARAGLPVGDDEHRAWRDEAFGALGVDLPTQEDAANGLG